MSQATMTRSTRVHCPCPGRCECEGREDADRCGCEKCKCKCNDMTMVHKFSCFNRDVCQMAWEEPMPSHERMSRCPLHHSSIAICGGGNPRLCYKCTEDGYYCEVDRSQGPWFPKCTVKRHPCSCGDENQTKELQCRGTGCGVKWVSKMTPMDRQKNCKVHAKKLEGPRICGPVPALCSFCADCTAKGAHATVERDRIVIVNSADEAIVQCWQCHAVKSVRREEGWLVCTVCGARK